MPLQQTTRAISVAEASGIDGPDVEEALPGEAEGVSESSHCEETEGRSGERVAVEAVLCNAGVPECGDPENTGNADVLYDPLPSCAVHLGRRGATVACGGVRTCCATWIM